MGYSIELKHKDGTTMTMGNSMFVKSNVVPVGYDENNGTFYEMPQTEASLGITYNYSKYYYEATEGDERFAHYDDGELVYGIRGLYGKTPKQSIEMLVDMVYRIKTNHQNKDKSWKIKECERVLFYDEKGNQLDIIDTFRDDSKVIEKVEKYAISEGDTSNYWESTAANAVEPLYDMIKIALEFIEEDECYWDGD